MSYGAFFDQLRAATSWPPEPVARPGRPAVGRSVTVRMEPDLIEWLDSEAEATGVTRAALVRALVREAANNE